MRIGPPVVTALGALLLFATALAGCQRAPSARSEKAAQKKPAAAAPTEFVAAEPPPPLPPVPATALVTVPAGFYRPFYKGATGAESIEVRAFQLDRVAVNREQFLEFVAKHPPYRKSRIKPLFAESTYLSDWPSDFDPGPNRGREPVTSVSWFAARAYCQAQGKRLPSMAEWERAATTDSGKNTKPEVRPTTDGLAHTGTGSPFQFAMGRAASEVKDPSLPTFAEVWEWTADFNSIFVPKGAIAAKDGDSNLFCGDGIRAVDATDYAGFLRYSFRNSLKANYALKNLGFRCAKDAP